jgi:hypothetical protein
METNVMPHQKSAASAQIGRYAKTGTLSYYSRLRDEDLNELCHLVISRHNRLRQLIQMRAPDIVVRNERRMLRAAVGAVVRKYGPLGVTIPDEIDESGDSFGCNVVALRVGIARVGLAQDTAKHFGDARTTETG